MVQLNSPPLYLPLRFADRLKNHPASFLFGLNCQIRSEYCVNSKFSLFWGQNIYFWNCKRILATASLFPTLHLGLFFDPTSWSTPAQVTPFPLLAPSGDRSWCNHTAYVTHSTIIIWRGVPTSPNLFITLCLGYSKVSAGHMWRLLLRLEAAQGDPLTTARLLLNR